MSGKRFTVVVYDGKAVNGFAVLDLQKPNNALRLKYESVYIGSKEGCEIVCRFGNSLAEENEQLRRLLEEKEQPTTINLTEEGAKKLRELLGLIDDE